MSSCLTLQLPASAPEKLQSQHFGQTLGERQPAPALGARPQKDFAYDAEVVGGP